jgi:N-acetylglucosamine-6-phosphate deacetylase
MVEVLEGSLVLDDAVATGRLEIDGEHITAVTRDDSSAPMAGPFICSGFVDIHVHGWGGHDGAAGDIELDRMARALIQRGITSFLPTAETSSVGSLEAFVASVDRIGTDFRPNRAELLGFNSEGPFISPRRAGAQNPVYIRTPSEADVERIEELLSRARVVTVAPELEGAIGLIRRLARSGVVVSLGHSDATAAQAVKGFDAGARSTTHLFNAMSGLDHHAPGLAAVGLTRDDVFVELIADGLHVDPVLWPIVRRTKNRGRIVLVSDAIAPAGAGDGVWTVGGLEVVVRGGECRVADGGQLAGSTIAIDDAVRNLVAAGWNIVDAVGAATRAPLDCIGIADRGRVAPGQLADLVELNNDLTVRRVMKRGRWLVPTANG